MTENKLKKLAYTLNEVEAAVLVAWIAEGMADLGLEHSEMCSISRPHSHSADCGCGVDELQGKIIRTLA